jgi:hypothetical protein
MAHLLALDGAPIANFGTDATVLCRKAALAGHGAQAQVTDLDAFPAAGRTIAASHFIRLHHVRQTVFAINKALIASFDTAFMS